MSQHEIAAQCIKLARKHRNDFMGVARAAKREQRSTYYISGLVRTARSLNHTVIKMLKNSAPTRDPLPGAETAGAVATNGGAPFSQSPP